MSDDDSRGADDGTPQTRREARESATPDGGMPLADEAFPGFDAESIPPRPPLPGVRPVRQRG